MCGVVGFSCKHPGQHHVAAIQRLFTQSKIRGLHAFGISYYEENQIKTSKHHKLVDCCSAIPLTNKLIGHCRYSTSGDYADHQNNQPIHLDNAAVVFNGVISMAAKCEYEKMYRRKYQTENDGEIFLDKFVRDEAWANFVTYGKFSFAGLVLWDDQLIAIRNAHRPLYRLVEMEAVFYASTADIFRRAGFDNEPCSVEPGQVYVD